MGKLIRSSAGARPVLALGLLAMLLAAPPARPAAAPDVLRGLAVTRSGGDEIIDLEFGSPLRFRSQAPSGAARQHEIVLVPVNLGPGGAVSLLRRETLRPPPAETSLLLEATLEAEPDESVTLTLRFTQPVGIQVESGSGFRGLRIQLVHAGGKASARRGALLLAEARRAMTRNELPRAIALLSKLLDHPKQADTDALRDAQELLAFAHERNGQLAHARAEYEAYLERYGEGEASQRVRQRLAALRTSTAPPSAPLRRERASHSGGMRPEMYGSVSASYARHQDVLVEGAPYDSSAATDLLLNARAEPGRLLLESEVAGSYRVDLVEDRANEAQISTLFVSVEDPSLSLQGTVGRQRPRGGGVLSRLDGAEVRGRLLEGLGWRAVAGLPVTSSDAQLESERQVFGLAVESKSLPAELEGEIFSVVQLAERYLDRAAIGGELRIARPGRHGLAYLDYDLLFTSLNTALVTGSQQVGEHTQLSGLVEFRNTPVLTLRSALQGQGTESLSDLSNSFDEGELRSLARDRTARLWSGTAGVSHRLDPDLQLGFDAVVSSLSGTPTSGGVAETEATGVDIGGTARVTLSRWLSSSDVHTLAVGAQGGERSRSARASLVSRQPLTRSLRLSPRMLFVYRNQTSSTPDSVSLHPSLGVDYRWRDLRVDAVFGTEFTHRLSGPDSDELALFAELVLRLDF